MLWILSKRDISIYTSLFFQEGTQQDLHRDAPLFCTYPENKFLGCWFALEDTNKSNGSLSVVPRGHIIIEEEDLIREQTSNYFYSLYPQKEIGFSEAADDLVIEIVLSHLLEIFWK